MSFELNVKELILKDVISKHKTGVSSISEWREKSNKYYFAKNLSKYSYYGSLATTMLYLTKSTSGRQSVYLIAPLALLASGYFFGGISQSRLESFKTESGINDDKKLKEFLYFHRYAII